MSVKFLNKRVIGLVHRNVTYLCKNSAELSRQFDALGMIILLRKYDERNLTLVIINCVDEVGINL